MVAASSSSVVISCFVFFDMGLVLSILLLLAHRGGSAISLCVPPSSPIIFLSLFPMCPVHGGHVFVLSSGFLFVGSGSCCVLSTPLVADSSILVVVDPCVSLFPSAQSD